MQISDYDQKVDISSVLSQGWGIFKQNIGSFVAFYLVAFVLLLIASCTVVGGLIVYMPLIMGFYLVADKIRKGETHTFGNFFGGFSHTFRLLMLVLFLSILSAVSFWIMASIFGSEPKSIDEMGTGISDSNRGYYLPFVALFGVVGNILDYLYVLLLGFIPVIYFAVAFGFAPLLITFEDAGLLEALKTSFKLSHSQLMKVIISYLLIGLIGISGVFIFSFGIIFTLPLALCMHYVLYRQLLGEKSE